VKEQPYSKLITQAIIWSIAGGLFVSLLVVWGVGFEGVIETFTHAKLWLIIAYLAVSLSIALLLTLKWQVVLDAYKVKMPFFTLFIYRLIGFAVGYVSPVAHVGGEPVRALLLNKQGIPLKVSFTSAMLDRGLELMFNVCLFFLGALIILNLTGFPLVARITIFTLSLIAIGVVGFIVAQIVNKRRILVPILKLLRFDRRKSWRKVREQADEIETLIEHFFSKRARHFRVAMLINACLWALMFLEYKVALLILGYDAPVFAIFLFLTGVGIAYSIPIPAALGVLELGQVSASALLGIQASIGLALAFLIRLRDIAWTVIGLILLGIFHLNPFGLYERSLAAGRKYKYESLTIEMRKLKKMLR